MRRLLTLWEIMQPFYVALFTELTRTLEAFAANPHVDDSLRTSFREMLIPAEQDCIKYGLSASTVTIRRMLKLLENVDCPVDKLRVLTIELEDRLRDETSVGREFFILSLEEVEYYRNWRKGWEQIAGRFSNTLGDIEEGWKCFALSRYAAAVFHSLQIVEVGLIELGTFISVSDPRSGWTAVANELKKIISKKYDDRTEFEKQHFEFLEQVQATTEALKNAWRNKISHVQGRLAIMTTDFSPEVAHEILMATRAFMRRLATELPK